VVADEDEDLAASVGRGCPIGGRIVSTAAPATTRAVVEELLRRIGEGDPERIAEMYAARSDWRLDWPEAEHGRAATPWIRRRSTRADAAAHYRELAGHHVPGQAATEIERILVDGDDAVVLGEIRQTARSTGRAYRARFALHLTVENGLVTRNHVYEDSLAVAQAFDVKVSGEDR
jgi:ketosteroid isomerase-like protein